MFVLVTYDVTAERTAVMRRLLRKFLGHEQFSVFYGDLTEVQAEKMRQEIRKKLVPGDRVTELVAANRHNVVLNHWTKEADTGTPSVVPDGRHVADTRIL
jgi:CRISPR-associated protein Cas2